MLKNAVEKESANLEIVVSISNAKELIEKLDKEFRSKNLDLKEKYEQTNENHSELKDNLNKFLNFLKKSAEESNCDLEFEGDEYDEEYREDTYGEGDDEEDEEEEYDGPLEDVETSRKVEVTGPQELVFQNNLKLVYQQKSENRSTGIHVFVNVGSSDEPPRLNGVSHIIEHMVFKGTLIDPYKNAESISKAFDEMGAYFNAFTDRTRTCYSVKCVSTDDNIKKSIEILSLMLFKSKFDGNSYKDEINVVKQEILQTNDDLDRVVNDKIHEQIFSRETDKVEDRISSRKNGNILRVGNPIAGDLNSIMDIDRGKALAFYNKFYRPSNMVVSIL